MNKSWFFKTVLLVIMLLVPVHGMTATVVYSEDFESYAIGTDLTSEGWTWHQSGSDTATLTVSIGKHGKCEVTSGTSAGSFTLDALSSLVNYTIDFDVVSYSGSITFGFRQANDVGYWSHCRPGMPFSSVLSTASTVWPTDFNGISTSQHPPATLTAVKIVISGDNMQVYYNGSSTAIHDITNATYGYGTIAIACCVYPLFTATPNFEIDNIVVTDYGEDDIKIKHFGIGINDDVFMRIKQ